MSTGDTTGGATDGELFGAIRTLWERADPVPPTLAERISFALELEDLEAELLRLEPELRAELAGARGEERTRTMTFGGASLAVMVTVSADGAAGVRLDGWVDAGDGGDVAWTRVELRSRPAAGRESVREVVADADGRFAIGGVPHGLAQLTFHPPGGGTVVTPAVEV